MMKKSQLFCEIGRQRIGLVHKECDTKGFESTCEKYPRRGSHMQTRVEKYHERNKKGRLLSPEGGCRELIRRTDERMSDCPVQVIQKIQTWKIVYNNEDTRTSEVSKWGIKCK